MQAKSKGRRWQQLGGDAGGFLDEQPQLVGLGLDQLGDHALLDDRVAARAETGPQEDVGDIPAAAFGAVEVILILRLAGHAAADGDFVVAGVFTLEGAVAVIEDQFDGRLANRLATVGAVEDDIGHRLAAQVLGRAFAHDPAYGIDDVGFATAVRPDHGSHIGREKYRGRVHKGLETRQFDALESHSVAC